MKSIAKSQEWTAVLTPDKPFFHLPIEEIWKYRGLLWLFIRRDIVTLHKQTVLGPVWFFIQPLISSVVLTIVMGRIANIPTERIPPFLFFLSGVTIWYYFSNVFTRTCNTFSAGAAIMSKVYFPRLIVPLGQTVVSLWFFMVQFLIFLGFYLFFYLKGAPIHPSYRVVIIPFLILQTGLLGFGLGCLVSALTVRFFDLQMAVAPALQLMMYASCIFFPRSLVPENLQWLMSINPMVPVIEAFRFAAMGQGDVEIYQWLVSFFLTLVIAFVGVIEFGRAEKNFADTV
jgi:lipopolysaccharide transport system permease protein